jgi:pyruvate kinase
MINEGMDVARINASFADEAELARVAELIRSISPKVALLLDTMGHKIRVIGFEKEKKLKEGEKITLVGDNGSAAPRDTIKLTYPTLHKDVPVGTQILIDDGNLELKVDSIKGRAVTCEVVRGGTLRMKKTVNIPGVHLTFPGLSEKDKKDLKSAVKLNYDFVSASFVRSRKDAKLVRKELEGSDIKVIAKVEDYEGVRNFDEILEEVDGIMVARGDLGVELPLEQVPILQKRFIKRCREVGKPVIVATQMLESMRESERPTRAEVSDVANAIMDGADAVMLSAESSTGKYPVESVTMITKIANEVEGVMRPQVISHRTGASEETDVISEQVVDLVERLDLGAVVVLTRSGLSAASISRHRLNVPIYAVTVNPKLLRQLCLLRGVSAHYVSDFNSDRDVSLRKAIEVVYAQGRLRMDSRVAIVSGGSIQGKRVNSILEVASVKDIMG